MRIGVISDTHNHLPNVARIVELLNAARVERVVHTGDITQAKTLRALAALDAPLYGVFGNNDVEREQLGAACAEHGHVFVEPPLRVEWAGRRIAVVHDPRELDALDLARIDVALYATIIATRSSAAAARSASTRANARATCPATTGSACSTW